MSLEYTHNDDVADMIYAKEQEIKLLKEALQRIEAELNRITNEYSRGLLSLGLRARSQQARQVPQRTPERPGHY